jgi:hypothetical protein
MIKELAWGFYERSKSRNKEETSGNDFAKSSFFSSVLPVRIN